MFIYSFTRQCVFQSSHPDKIQSFNNIGKLRWKSFTPSKLIICSGKRLYTQIKPRALRRSIYRKRMFLISNSCILCLLLALRVLLLCCSDAAKQMQKCSGPFSSTQRWISQSIAMSRLHENGAKLKLNKASSSVIQNSRKNLNWNLSSGARTVSHA